MLRQYKIGLGFLRRVGYLTNFLFCDLPLDNCFIEWTYGAFKGGSLSGKGFT